MSLLRKAPVIKTPSEKTREMQCMLANVHAELLHKSEVFEELPDVRFFDEDGKFKGAFIVETTKYHYGMNEIHYKLAIFKSSSLLCTDVFTNSLNSASAVLHDTIKYCQDCPLVIEKEWMRDRTKQNNENQTF